MFINFNYYFYKYINVIYMEVDDLGLGFGQSPILINQNLFLFINQNI